MLSLFRRAPKRVRAIRLGVASAVKQVLRLTVPSSALTEFEEVRSMTTKKHIVSSLRIVGLVAFICLTLLAASVWSSIGRFRTTLTKENSQRHSPSQEEIDAMAEGLQPDKVPVWNMTRFVRFIKIDKIENRDLALTLQNGYDKKINGFLLSVGDVGIYTEYMYNPDQMIPPGGTWVDQVPIEPFTDTKGITLMSVFFDDGTSDGDEAAIKGTQEDRAGQKAQIRRALALIRQTLGAPNVESVAALDELLSQLRSLPIERVIGRPNFSVGQQSAKDRLISIIETLRERQGQSVFRAQGFQHPQTEVSISTKLMGMVERHERVVSRR